MTTLSTTDATSVYTVPNDKIAIVKTLSAYNVDASSAMTLTVQMTDTSESATVTWDIESIATTTRKAFLTAGEVLVLDEADIIKLTASTANKFNIFMSILETDQRDYTMNNNNPLKNAAQHLASKGRYGDSMLVHMNPIEVDMLSSLSPTGQLTTNPDTGQKEAFLPLLFSMIAPSVLGSAVASPLIASAIGSGIGTIAEGGSLKEGITAGLMGGLTGGLMNKAMPEMANLFGEGAKEGVSELAGQALPESVISGNVGSLGAPTIATQGLTPPLPASSISGNMGSLGVPSSLMGITPDIAQQAASPTFGSKMMDSLGNPFSSANIGDTASSVGAGMVGEMYVPFDTPEMLEEESEYQYEGPYMPTEQRRTINMGDPFASAFGGEQTLLEGDVLPQGYNMRPDGYSYGGLVNRLNKGGMVDTQEQIESLAAEQRVRSDMNKEQQKRFRDFQPEGSLKGTVFDYVPDKIQLMQFMMDRMGYDEIPRRPAPPLDPERQEKIYTGREEFVPRGDEAFLDPRRFIDPDPAMLDPRRFIDSDQSMLDPRRTMAPERQEKIYTGREEFVPRGDKYDLESIKDIARQKYMGPTE